GLAGSTRPGSRRNHRKRKMAGAPAGPVALSAVAAARFFPKLFARGQRSRPDFLRPFCGRKHHRRDQGRHSPGRRRRSAALLSAPSPHPHESRCTDRTRSVGAFHPDLKLSNSDLIAAIARGISRYCEPRLLCHQNGAVDHGVDCSHAGAARYRAPIAPGPSLMAWCGFVLLLLVGVGIVGTGLPAAVVLIVAASIGAVLGLATDT